MERDRELFTSATLLKNGQTLLENQSQDQRPDIAKYSFVNRSITDWYILLEVAKLTTHGKVHIFKTRVKKVKSSEGK